MNITSNASSANSGSGLTVQNFKILRTINKGAFAQVYEALDTITNRTLALKIVSPPLVSMLGWSGFVEVRA